MTTTTTTTTARIMATSPSSHPEAEVLPSLSPSPSLLDEVFSYPRPWSVRNEELGLKDSRRSSSGSSGSHVKRKNKRTIADEDEDGEDAQPRAGIQEAYPPTTDEAAETRGVEETLKRWELAERQRRKSARESMRHTSGPSLLSSVTRTASLVLSGRASVGTSVGPGSTRTFKSHEAVDVAREGYAVPLDDINHAPASRNVAVYSPSSSFLERNASMDVGPGMASGSGTSENPFVHPSERSPTPELTPVTSTFMLSPSAPASPSPFADPHVLQAVRRDLTTRVSAESKNHVHKRSSASRPPSVLPPPLDLPPPPEDTPRTTQLQRTLQPVHRPREDPEDRQEVRWWHEWLCGCGEGPDRGGDSQAGRTNPFE